MTVQKTVKVWSPAIRVFHWSLATCIAVAWLTSEGLRNLHEFFGYAAACLIAFRLALGLAGGRYARFAQFVRSPGHVLAYLRDVRQHREARYLGHNPLGAVMVMFLLALIGAIALTGWMQTTDAFWGVEWVEETHEAAVNMLLVAVVLHLLGVIHAGHRHGENLVRAMITGRKRAPAGSDKA
ncbi:cytochrome b/b6 domain-containing protein [Rhizobium sp. CSW-27]|uniref:cytochrome b/b6 domain-containing protein n=1 Tax=Rhizobium sp. CSW-27 TaxID=2839985 RepID=UPI001C01DE8D|nr:cytochrome b/b6 domain-containing protein [Rhizobium sp. CSW-27]MBT9369832.1 cytochrome b/b6 domain-containing protein [Rhizobium sp. CSW-27]